MPLNTRLLRIEIANKGDRVIRPAIERAIKLDFKVKKEQFIEEFDAHPVTQELEAGPDALSSVPSIAATGGNLFSLLGFFKEQRPVTALRTYLKKSVKVGETRRGKIQGYRIVFETPVTVPTQEDVDAAMAANPDTVLEWTDRPFTSLIARGITGLPSYLFNLTKSNKGSFASSRSGPAVQASRPVRTGSTGPIRYIGDVLGYLKRLIGPKK